MTKPGGKSLMMSSSAGVVIVNTRPDILSRTGRICKGDLEFFIVNMTNRNRKITESIIQHIIQQIQQAILWSALCSIESYLQTLMQIAIHIDNIIQDFPSWTYIRSGSHYRVWIQHRHRLSPLSALYQNSLARLLKKSEKCIRHSDMKQLRNVRRGICDF